MVALLSLGVAGCGGGSDADSSQAADDRGMPPVAADVVDPTEVDAGGGNTVDRQDTKAFSQSNPQLDLFEDGKFKEGNLEFRSAHSGLGPLFNTQTCQGCHKEDGRGNPPDDLDDDGVTDTLMTSLLIRLSIAGPDAADPVVAQTGSQPDPVYGAQLQSLGGITLPGREAAHNGSLSGLPEDALGEGFAFIVYDSLPGQYADGAPYTLHRPIYKVRDLSYGPFASGIELSPRLAPQMIGLGLLGAIPAADILQREDPDDADADGISGRANRVWDEFNQTSTLGRFGHKASQPTVLQQLAGAYRGDIGITNTVFPNEPCTPQQAACLALAADEPQTGAAVDVDDVTLALVEFYSRQLAVPMRRGWNAGAQSWDDPIWRGRQLFFAANCTGCHTPRHRTGVAAGSELGDIANTLDALTQPSTPIASLSEQIIWPFTDLLLHDMGGSCQAVAREMADGSPCAATDSADCLWVQRCDGLADGRPVFDANGSEWRTPPLWGLGLAQTVNPKAGFLHDGRARTIEEAILWHGHPDSEARSAWSFFVNLSASERRDLLMFLESL